MNWLLRVNIFATNIGMLALTSEIMIPVVYRRGNSHLIQNIAFLSKYWFQLSKSLTYNESKKVINLE